MNVGDAFVNVNPDTPSHLWIVITAPTAEAAEVGIVNLTSRNPPCDDTCIVTHEEHPFVHHDSIIEYRRGKLVANHVLDSAYDHGYLRMHQRASPELLRRIQEGALTSRHTKQALQAAVRATLNRS